jgi:PPK2 family polyphosphate:nucleotide phosphotransferase
MPDHRIAPGQRVELDAIPTDGKEYVSDKREAEKTFRKLHDELIALQPRLYAENQQRLLIVMQALDAGGKDSTIRNVFTGVNPQGVQVHGFKVPSARELAHDFLWRIHQVVPAAGMIGVFNRSHYEDVVVVRVHQLVAEEIWRPRYDLINSFERLLASTGTRILKFFLHISRAEQKKRFEERLADPEKHFKFSRDDLDKRRDWDAYQAAYEEALSRCSTEYAPWYVIPSDRKWYRNLAVTSVIVETLRDMRPEFPPLDYDPAQITVE